MATMFEACSSLIFEVAKIDPLSKSISRHVMGLLNTVIDVQQYVSNPLYFASFWPHCSIFFRDFESEQPSSLGSLGQASRMSTKGKARQDAEKTAISIAQDWGSKSVSLLSVASILTPSQDRLFLRCFLQLSSRPYMRDHSEYYLCFSLLCFYSAPISIFLGSKSIPPA